MSPIRLLYAVALLLELAALAYAQPPIAPPVVEVVPTAAVAPPLEDTSAPGFCVSVKRDEPNGYAHGGGTVIASEDGRSLILTNAHVARDAARPLTVTAAGREYRAAYLAGSRVYDIGFDHLGRPVIAIDGPDLAVLQVDAELPAAPVALAAPRVGSRVRQWGYADRAYNAAPNYKTGTVLGESGNDLLTTLQCDHGDSGAALLDDHGEVVAVCHGKPPANQPAGQVRQYAVRTGVTVTFVEEKAPRLFGRLRDRIAARRLARELAKAPPVRIEPPIQTPKAEPKPIPKAAPPVVVAPQPFPPVIYYYSYQYDPRVRGYRQVQYAAPPCVNGQCPRR